LEILEVDHDCGAANEKSGYYPAEQGLRERNFRN
jgi:hypothetical protein